jgi:hypothetical protein
VCKVSIRKAQRRAIASSSGRKTPDNSSDYFGHPWDEWFAMCDAGRDLILESVRLKRFLPYPEFWSGIKTRLQRDIGDPWRQEPLLLEYISDRTYEDLGLFITAMVIDPETGHPSEGFFRLAAARGALPEQEAPEMGVTWKQMTPKQKVFWEDQARKIFERVSGQI